MRVQDARVVVLASDDRIKSSLATLMCGSGRSGTSCHACALCEGRVGRRELGFAQYSANVRFKRAVILIAMSLGRSRRSGDTIR
jgi:hypothetical protein